MKKVVKGIVLMAIIFALFGCEQPTDTGTTDIPTDNVVNDETGGTETPKEQVAVPTFSPVGGSYPEGDLLVTITPPDGATAYYTVDGTAPSTSSIKYESSFSITIGASEIEVKAIAVKESMTNSAIASAIYKKEQVATPTVHYDGNPLQENNAILFSKGVSFDCATTGVTYSYKFSGDTDFKPLASGVTSVSPIPEGSKSVMVKASKTDYTDSEEKTVTFIKEYAVGETGPGGGTIFYKDGTGAYKQVVFLSSGKNQSEAKTEAENYSVTVDGTTYSDWFLPNKNELNEVYETLKKTGNITETGTFWSSTATEEYYGTPISTFAWTQNFADGIQNIKVSVSETHDTIAIRCYNPIVYEVGNTGPAGGTIYWVGANNAYKEVSNNIGSFNWFQASGTHDAVHNALATSVAGNYITTENGEIYIDWYLPTKTELNELYNKKDSANITEMGDLWSSSASLPGFAWVQYFSNGDQYGIDKTLTYGVRAIRAFNTSSL